MKKLTLKDIKKTVRKRLSEQTAGNSRILKESDHDEDMKIYARAVKAGTLKPAPGEVPLYTGKFDWEAAGMKKPWVEKSRHFRQGKNEVWSGRGLKGLTGWPSQWDDCFGLGCISDEGHNGAIKAVDRAKVLINETIREIQSNSGDMKRNTLRYASGLITALKGFGPWVIKQADGGGFVRGIRAGWLRDRINGTYPLLSKAIDEGLMALAKESAPAPKPTAAPTPEPTPAPEKPKVKPHPVDEPIWEQKIRRAVERRFNRLFLAEQQAGGLKAVLTRAMDSTKYDKKAEATVMAAIKKMNTYQFKTAEEITKIVRAIAAAIQGYSNEGVSGAANWYEYLREAEASAKRRLAAAEAGKAVGKIDGKCPGDRKWDPIVQTCIPHDVWMGDGHPSHFDLMGGVQAGSARAAGAQQAKHYEAALAKCKSMNPGKRVEVTGEFNPDWKEGDPGFLGGFQCGPARKRSSSSSSRTVKKCAEPGKEYGQQNFRPEKKRSKKGDAEYDKFYADLEKAGLTKKLGKYGPDYKWGRLHRKAYKSLLCTKDFKPAEKPAEKRADQPTPGTGSGKYVTCDQINNKQFDLMNINRKKYGLDVVAREDCEGKAFIRSGAYMGLTVAESKTVTGQPGKPKPAEGGLRPITPEEARSVQIAARRLYELHDGHTDSDEEMEIYEIVKKHIENKSIGLLHNLYFETHKRLEPDKPMSLTQMLNYEGSGAGGSEGLRRLAAVVEKALSRPTRGAKFRGQ